MSKIYIHCIKQINIHVHVDVHVCVLGKKIKSQAISKIDVNKLNMIASELCTTRNFLLHHNVIINQ